MEDPQAITHADEFIAFLANVHRFKLKVEIALIVDNQVCDSTFQLNPRTEKGGQVLEYLTQAAIGARLGLYRDFGAVYTQNGGSPPDFGV
jgi:hypothetical protein